MHWLVTDETNIEPNQGDFFIYGGLVLTDRQMSGLHEAVMNIRTKHGYRPGDNFKFQVASRPPQVDVEEARRAKQEVLQEVERLGGRLIVYVILHDIADSDLKIRMRYAMNTVLWNFRMLLLKEQAMGVVSIDRVDENYGFEHLQHLLQHGLTFQSGDNVHLDDRIIYYGMSSNNASHISSAVDIAIGGFRYCVNAASGKGRAEVAGDIFPTLARLMWSQEVAGQRYIGGYGYIERPVSPRVDSYRERYRDLRETLAEYAGAAAHAPPEAGAAP